MRATASTRPGSTATSSPPYESNSSRRSLQRHDRPDRDRQHLRRLRGLLGPVLPAVRALLARLPVSDRAEHGGQEPDPVFAESLDTRILRRRERAEAPHLERVPRALPRRHLDAVRALSAGGLFP